MLALENLSNSLDTIIQQTQLNFPLLWRIVALPWLVLFINTLLHGLLFRLGIIPRRLIGIPGIFCAPLIHANFSHLFFNTIPLVVLSDFMLIQGWDYFLYASFFITVVSGFLIWCFAKQGIHIGASGLITGYWGLLVIDIYQQGSLTAIILGALSLYYFAGIFLGIFPQRKGISWEGHLFGLLAGIGFSYLYRVSL